MLNGIFYALKIIPKYNLHTSGRLNILINEPNILKRFNNTNKFVPDFICSFQDYDNFYIVTTFYDGPNLSKIINTDFTEEQIKFVGACIILSLKYIREKEVIHRDLSADNIIMDKNNYFNLIDFSSSVDYSKRYSKELECNIEKRTNLPWILIDNNYDYNYDYYVLGAVLFLMVFKNYPFFIEQRNNLTKLFIDNNLIGKYSKNFNNFLECLLVTKVEQRIGYNNIDELVNHPWFHEFNWEKLEKKEAISPFSYNRTGKNKNLCQRFIKLQKMVDSYRIWSKEKNYQKLLQNFDFTNNILEAGK